MAIGAARHTAGLPPAAYTGGQSYSASKPGAGTLCGPPQSACGSCTVPAKDNTGATSEVSSWTAVAQQPQAQVCISAVTYGAQQECYGQVEKAPVSHSKYSTAGHEYLTQVRHSSDTAGLKQNLDTVVVSGVTSAMSTVTGGRCCCGNAAQGFSMCWGALRQHWEAWHIRQRRQTQMCLAMLEQDKGGCTLHDAAHDIACARWMPDG